MILFGNNGGKWEIEDTCFAKGGEGELYHVVGTEGHVVKLYKGGMLTPTKQEKLTYMTTLYSKDRMNQLAWPIDMVKDTSDQIKGFVMKRFSATEDMADLLDESSNKSMHLDWKKRVIIALNLALLVNEIHSMGQIIGDMNPKNFGVDMNNGFVCAFDTDSFHLHNSSEDKWYPCTVLDPHYIAPELQEKFQKGQRVDSFRPQETFTQETDRFALAILIFQLLFNGTHPFTAARVPSRGSSVIVHSRVTNIYQRMCPYFNPSSSVTLPRYAPPLSIVPENMQNAFRKAFLENSRPNSGEWVEMLNTLRHQLIQCSHGHYYGQYNASCPWCIKESSSSKVHTPPSTSNSHVSSASSNQVLLSPSPQTQPPNTQKQLKKYRSWYAHEIINLIVTLLVLLVLIFHGFEMPAAVIGSIGYGIVLLSKYIHHKIAGLSNNQGTTVLPAGPGVKVTYWVNKCAGICILIYFTAWCLSDSYYPTSFILLGVTGCELLQYGVGCLKDAKAEKNSAVK